MNCCLRFSISFHEYHSFTHLSNHSNFRLPIVTRITALNGLVAFSKSWLTVIDVQPFRCTIQRTTQIVSASITYRTSCSSYLYSSPCPTWTANCALNGRYICRLETPVNRVFSGAAPCVTCLNQCTHLTFMASARRAGLRRPLFSWKSSHA